MQIFKMSLQVKLRSSSEGTWLPPARKVNAINLGQERQEELQLCKKWEVVGGDERVWAAADVVLH